MTMRGGLAVFAIAFLLVTVPVCSGATSVPFSKLSPKFGSSTYTWGCGKVHQSRSPHFSNRTGVFLASGSATTPSCPAFLSNDSAVWNGEVNFTKLLSFKHHARHLITFAWNVSESASWSIHPFSSCTLNYSATESICLTNAFAILAMNAGLYDVTTGGPVLASKYFYNLNYSEVRNWSQYTCISGTCTVYSGNTSVGGLTGSFNRSFDVNLTIHATGRWARTSDQYRLTCFLLVAAQADAYAVNATPVGAGSATALVNLGQGGFEAKLISVSIT